MMTWRWATAAFGIVAAGLAGAAGAGACPASLDSPSGFRDAEHRQWYARFWTGQCDAALSWCFAGSPNWGELIQSVERRAPADARVASIARACALGERIGREWALPNDERRIDTRQLKRLRADFDAEADVGRGLARIEAAADAALRGGTTR